MTVRNSRGVSISGVLGLKGAGNIICPNILGLKGVLQVILGLKGFDFVCISDVCGLKVTENRKNRAGIIWRSPSRSTILNSTWKSPSRSTILKELEEGSEICPSERTTQE